MKHLSIIAIFKDPRQLMKYPCCQTEDMENRTFIASEIKKRLTEKYIRYYRMISQQPLPNNQVPH